MSTTSAASDVNPQSPPQPPGRCCRLVSPLPQAAGKFASTGDAQSDANPVRSVPPEIRPQSPIPNVADQRSTTTASPISNAPIPELTPRPRVPAATCPGPTHSGYPRAPHSRSPPPHPRTTRRPPPAPPSFDAAADRVIRLVDKRLPTSIEATASNEEPDWAYGIGFVFEVMALDRSEVGPVGRLGTGEPDRPTGVGRRPFGRLRVLRRHTRKRGLLRASGAGSRSSRIRMRRRSPLRPAESISTASAASHRTPSRTMVVDHSTYTMRNRTVPVP